MRKKILDLEDCQISTKQPNNCPLKTGQIMSDAKKVKMEFGEKVQKFGIYKLDLEIFVTISFITNLTSTLLIAINEILFV